MRNSDRRSRKLTFVRTESAVVRFEETEGESSYQKKSSRNSADSEIEGEINHVGDPEDEHLS